VVEVGRGQLAASIRFMAEAWGWTAAKVQRFMERLKKLEMIRAETDTGLTLLTVCNYDKFQAQSKASDTEAIQDRYTSDTNEKKGVIREGNTEAKASDGQAVDFAKQLWDRGVAFLGRHGTPDKQARTLIGKWRKAYTDTDIFDAFAACSKEGIIDPVPWITAKLAGKDKPNGKSSRGEKFLRSFVAGASVAPRVDFGEDCDPSQPLLARG
jgi:hypothetical protein